MNVLITGVAGFIGSSLCKRILEDFQDTTVIGIDNINAYYDVNIKYYRLEQLTKFVEQFVFIKGNIADKFLVDSIFAEYKPDIVINFAAQAGVRYSISNPDLYIESNLIGFYNILEACRHSYDYGNTGVKHLVYASSSSVYGDNKKVPFSINDKVDTPNSLYAATKKSNELMAYVYSKLYNIPSTGLRFFTVYGPAGRPDMAYFSFTDKMLKGEVVKIYNYGCCERDFTYIDDIIEAVTRIIVKPPEPQIDNDGCFIPPYKIYNIGNNHPENILNFIQILKEELIRAEILPFDYDIELNMEKVPMQLGDIHVTYADTIELEKEFGFKPSTPLRVGLRKFVEWYRRYNRK